MFKFIPFIIVLLGFCACTKDSTSISNDSIEVRADEAQSSFDLKVYVSYVDHGAATCEPIFMENIQVYIIEGLIDLDDFSTDDVMMSRKTDEAGKAILESLEAGNYSVYVSTIYGNSIKLHKLEAGNSNLVNIELVK